MFKAIKFTIKYINILSMAVICQATLEVRVYREPFLWTETFC